MMTWFGRFLTCSRRLLAAHAPGALAWTVGLVSLLAAFGAPASADDDRRRVLLIENTAANVPAPLRTRVDRALREAAERQRTIAIETSPMPFEEVAMAAGCGDRGDACGARIAATLEGDSLLVRELELTEAGMLLVRLVAHERGSGESNAEEANLGLDGPSAPEQTLPRLLAKLYGSNERAAAAPAEIAPRVYAVETAPTEAAPPDATELQKTAEPTLSSDRGKSLPLRVVGWTLTTVGAGLLTAGIVVGAISKRDHREYADVNIERKTDVDRALPHLERAQKHARQANGFLAGGGGALAVGVGVLLYAYLRGGDRAPQTALMVAPTRHGFALGFSRSFSPL